MADTAPVSISMDLSDTKTTIPMIQDGHMCRWRLNTIGQVGGEKGQTLVWEWHLVEPAPSTDGTTINPGDLGSKFFERIQLYSKPDSKDPDWYKKRISQRIDALLGTGDRGNPKSKPERPALTPETVTTLIGKELIAKMSVRTGEYTGNEFKTVTFPGDIGA